MFCINVDNHEGKAYSCYEDDPESKHLTVGLLLLERETSFLCSLFFSDHVLVSIICVYLKYFDLLASFLIKWDFALLIQNYDAVVGDTAITANRSNYGGLTQPYLENGVAMIVPKRSN